LLSNFYFQSWCSGCRVAYTPKQAAAERVLVEVEARVAGLVPAEALDRVAGRPAAVRGMAVRAVQG